MRLIFVLLIALVITAVLTLFPEVANQEVRIDAFGWILETRQGAFVVALLLVLLLLWLVRRIVAALLAGPGQLWQTLKMGSRRRREERLREGLGQWLDMRDDLGAKALRKGRHALPSWTHELLKGMAIAATDQPLPAANADPLRIVLAARIATDPHANPKPDLVTRKAHLEAWLAAHPGAPLALLRLADIAEEEGDWKHLAALLEDAWKSGHQSSAMLKPRLARAYARLAEEESEERQTYLRKAHRLAPEDGGVILALGEAYLANGEAEAARKLWISHLEQFDDDTIASALYRLMEPEALKYFQQLDRKGDTSATPAMQWLRASLAHKAGLDGLAGDILDQLLRSHSAPYILKTRADWLMESGDHEAAAGLFRKALELGCGQPSGSDLQQQ